MEAEDIVDKMLAQDIWSKQLGMELLVIETGYCKLQMRVTNAMVNGFGIAHGSISYALADSAMAFAANSFGRIAVSIHTDIKHLNPIQVGEVIIAETKLISKSNSLLNFLVRISDQSEQEKAHFNGTCYVRSKEWINV